MTGMWYNSWGGSSIFELKKIVPSPNGSIEVFVNLEKLFNYTPNQMGFLRVGMGLII